MVNLKLLDTDLTQLRKCGVNLPVTGLHGLVERQIAVLQADGGSVLRAERDERCAGVYEEMHRRPVHFSRQHDVAEGIGAVDESIGNVGTLDRDAGRAARTCLGGWRL